jgi:hypothetical protein
VFRLLELLIKAVLRLEEMLTRFVLSAPDVAVNEVFKFEETLFKL